MPKNNLMDHDQEDMELDEVSGDIEALLEEEEDDDEFWLLDEEFDEGFDGFLS